MQPALDEAKRLLARRVIADDRVGVRVDQPWPELAATRVDDMIDPPSVDCAGLADRRSCRRGACDRVGTAKA